MGLEAELVLAPRPGYNMPSAPCVGRVRSGVVVVAAAVLVVLAELPCQCSAGVQSFPVGQTGNLLLHRHHIHVLVLGRRSTPPHWRGGNAGTTDQTPHPRR